LARKVTTYSPRFASEPVDPAAHRVDRQAGRKVIDREAHRPLAAGGNREQERTARPHAENLCPVDSRRRGGFGVRSPVRCSAPPSQVRSRQLLQRSRPPSGQSQNTSPSTSSLASIVSPKTECTSVVAMHSVSSQQGNATATLSTPCGGADTGSRAARENSRPLAGIAPAALICWRQGLTPHVRIPSYPPSNRPSS